MEEPPKPPDEKKSDDFLKPSERKPSIFSVAMDVVRGRRTVSPRIQKGKIEVGETVNVKMAAEDDEALPLKAKKGAKKKTVKQKISATGQVKGSATVKGVGSAYTIPENKSPPREKDGVYPLAPVNYYLFINEDAGFNKDILASEILVSEEKNKITPVAEHDVVYLVTSEKNKWGVYGWAEVGKIATKPERKILDVQSRKTHAPMGDEKFLRQVIKSRLAFVTKTNGRPLVFPLLQKEAEIINTFLLYTPQPIVFLDDDTPVQKTIFDHTVKTQSDAASVVDHLERKEMAAAFSERLQKMWNRNSNSHTQDPLIIHLNAPWGAGKTTFFYLLRGNLIKMDPAWIVVDFNAWRHQHMNPPWWNLLQEIYQQALRQLKTFKERDNLRTEEFWRRARAGRHSLFLILLTLAVAMVVVPRIFNIEVTDPPLEFWKNTLAGLTAIISFAVLIHGTLLGGSSRSAKLFSEVTKDPQNSLKKHFQNLVQDIEQPILVFIDDIDRCKPRYVVDLLEGIMTIFRSNRCIFLIAGDAYWIQECFEKTYEDFKHTAKNPGKTLGHNFLEKVFQFSLALPPISEEIRNRFWAILLGQKSAISINEKAENEKETLNKEDKNLLEEYKKIQENREEALSAYTLEETDEKAEHFLMQFSSLIEPNPRAMKRLVNAYVAFAISQVSHKNEGLSNDEKTKLALWTILTQRWPVLIEHFVTYPQHIPKILDCAEGARFPKHDEKAENYHLWDIENLFINDPDVKNVLKGDFGDQKKKSLFTQKEIQFYLGLLGD